MRKLILIVVFSGTAFIFTSNILAASSPTPQQMELFKQLSPAQKQQAIDALVSKQGSAKTPAKSITEPEVVIPRVVVTNEKLESVAEEGADAPSLLEKKQEKAINPPLKQFGYDLFAGTPTTFAPATDIPIPTEYIVGPGDNVQVQLFGKENAEYDLVVSREGKLSFPGIGPISVAGLRFDELKQSLAARIKRQMIGVKANITMGTLRSIRIFVLGDVIRPGSYTVSALSNMTNALFYSGGVKPIGSLRKIQLKRNGKIITTLDLYDLLLRGDTSNDKRLQPGDVIFVPPIGKTVGVAGEVRRPAVYELNKEQTIADALSFSGGLLPTAYPKVTQLERITPRGDRTLVDIDASDEADLQLGLNDGDVVRVYSILEKMQNIVLVSGHALRPGGFQWIDGMRLSDLLPSVDVLLPKPDLDYVLIKREILPDRRLEVITTRLSEALKDTASLWNTLLAPRDEIILFGLEENRQETIAPIVKQLERQERFTNPAAIITINGNVHYSGTYPYSHNMRVTDALRAAFDLRTRTDLDYAIVSRQKNSGEKLEAFSFSLREALMNPNSSANIVLKPRDEILIFNVEEKKEKTDKRQIEIKSTLEKELNLIAGDNQKIKYIDRQALIKPLIKTLHAQTKHGEYAPIVTVSGLVTAPGEYPLDKNMQIKDLIRAAGKLTESAYTISAELTRFKIVNGEYREINHYTITRSQIFDTNIAEDLTLEPYDHLQIKRMPLWAEEQTIELLGEVKFPGRYPFRRGETVEQVMERAGGFTDQAFLDGVVFTREDLRQREQKQIDSMAARLESDLAAISLEKSQSTTTDVRADNQSVALAASLLKQLRSTKAIGRLVIDLKAMLAEEESDDEFGETQRLVLKNGDKLYVPAKTQEITIIGEVQQSTSHLYSSNLSRDDYVNLSGGLTYKADDDRIYIVRANGAVVSDENTGWFGGSKYVKPGDTIVVPLDADRMRPLTLWTNITQIIYQLGIAAAAWQTVGIL
ncbi:MAG: hypothetical protein GXP08_11470 [Gammaproteobacteria bacterium]|nr:hypothetical protein [Gammaproteobacteria bacterium]